jgi:hypothetical protein
MAEYTPTTRDVKRKYMLVVPGSGEAERAFHYGPTDKGAEFDRWLAAHDREVRNAVIQEVHDEVRMIPCYGKNGRMEFDIGPFARTQVLDVINGMRTDA